jgi:hypothetical protein
MQLAQPRGNLIEKIIRDTQGRLVRATFCVYIQGDQVKARLINAVLIEQTTILENTILALSGSCTAHTSYKNISFVHSFVSPYIDTDLLYTAGSKPRAPTIN